MPTIQESITEFFETVKESPITNTQQIFRLSMELARNRTFKTLVGGFLVFNTVSCGPTTPSQAPSGGNWLEEIRESNKDTNNNMRETDPETKAARDKRTRDSHNAPDQRSNKKPTSK